MNLKEAMFLVKEYHLPLEKLLKVQKKAEEYPKYLLKNENSCLNNSHKWKTHLKDVILEKILHSDNNSIIIGEKERAREEEYVFEYRMNDFNAVVYFNDLTKAELKCILDKFGKISSFEKEWIYSNGFKTILTIKEHSVETNNICSVDFLVTFLESEGIKQGNTDLIRQYLETGKEPKSLTLPCYEVEEENIRIVL